MKTLIHNVTIYPDENVQVINGGILFEDGKVVEILSEKGVSAGIKSADAVVDGAGMDLLPGFIDVHCHGAYGYDFTKEPEQCIAAFEKQAVREGCTAYLASLAPDTHENLLRSMEKYQTLSRGKGAECLGVHMEGCFVSPKYPGAMRKACILAPDLEKFKALIAASNGHIRQMTIAPELPGALELIRYGSENNISMMLGHSGAAPAEAYAAVLNGARGLTHMYNAMGQHEHRQPGLVTAGFLYDHLICELISDGFHVSPEVVAATHKLIGDRIALITDATMLRGVPDGDYTLMGHKVRKAGISARIEGTGTIAGSVVGMDDVVKSFSQFTGCSLNDIVKVASVNPAVIAGCECRKGRLLPGYDADMVILDRQREVRAVYVGGIKYF